MNEDSVNMKASLKGVKEAIALEEIVYHRTEGLLILEKLLSHSLGSSKEVLYTKIKNHYQESQPKLVSLCENRSLNLSLSTFEQINQHVESIMHNASQIDSDLHTALVNNLSEQRSLYLNILEDEELSFVHYYILDCYLEIVCFMEDIHHNEELLPHIAQNNKQEVPIPE